MEEKKLTDEELIKALTFCRAGDSCSKCPLNVPYSQCNTDLSDQLLDIIQRLQAENAELKSKKFGMWKVKFYKAQEEIERLKTENKKLTEENRVIKHNLDFHRNGKFELQTQVDELTDKLGKVLLGVKADEVLIAKGVEQAIKDTAKEIANWLPTTVNEDKNVLSMIIKENYGVEVE